jgi:hypothetical protein
MLIMVSMCMRMNLSALGVTSRTSDVTSSVFSRIRRCWWAREVNIIRFAGISNFVVGKGNLIIALIEPKTSSVIWHPGSSLAGMVGLMWYAWRFACLQRLFTSSTFKRPSKVNVRDLMEALFGPDKEL